MNIAGLGVGMACFLLITMFVVDELSYDKYHSNYERMYRVLHSNKNGGVAGSATPAPEDFRVWGNATVGPALKNDLPEIESFFRFTSDWAFLFEHNGQKTRIEHMVYADSTAFEVFSWNLLTGNPKTCLASPSSIVLTQSISAQLFGDENPVGKTIKKIQPRGEPMIYHITGVMEDVPSNSHFTFDGLVSWDIYKLLAGAILFAVPLSWYAMNQWLNNFAYRINIGPEIYALAVVVALSIATITISWQAVRAAISNPVNALRNE